ncbi:MAG TPA: nucleotidyltransferase family protein, partial [Longimicrobiaceae bacterium]
MPPPASPDRSGAPPREVLLLLRCARLSLSPGDARRIARLARGPLDWDLLLRAAEHHGLTPLLHRHLAAVAADAVPSGVAAALASAARAAALDGLRMAGEMAACVARLE